MTDNTLRLASAADYLDVHRDTLRRWARQGRVPHERLGERGDLRFRLTDLDQLLLKDPTREHGGDHAYGPHGQHHAHSLRHAPGLHHAHGEER